MKREPIFPCGLDFFFCSSWAPEESGHSMHRLRREAARNLGRRRVTYLGASVKSWRRCCFAQRRSAILIQIGRRPERARILRIKGAQRRLDSVAEAGYALFDSWTQ